MRYRLFFFSVVTLHLLTAAAQITPYQGPAWQKLRTKLNSYSVFGLGETGHGYESINAVKGILIDFLRRELDVRSVVFESSFTLCALGYLRGDSLGSRLAYSLYPFWNTASVQAALHPFDLMERADKPLIAGCDIQEDCRFVRLSQYLIAQGWIKANIRNLLAADSILAFYIGKDFSRRSALSGEEYSILTRSYEAVATELKSHSLPEIKQKLLLRSLDNRKWLGRYLTLSSAKERMYYRDSVMAANVVWLKTELYPMDKIALWAANTHIAGQKMADNDPQWMGEWLSGYYKDLYCPISFQKGSFTDDEALSQEFGVRYSSKTDKYSAIILLNNLRKISSNEWRTPCD